MREREREREGGGGERRGGRERDVGEEGETNRMCLTVRESSVCIKETPSLIWWMQID